MRPVGSGEGRDGLSRPAATVLARELGGAGGQPAGWASAGSQPLPPPAPKRGAESVRNPHKNTLGLRPVPCTPCSDAIVVQLREGIFKYVDGAEGP